MPRAGSWKRSARRSDRHGRERKSSSSTTGPPIKHCQLCKSLLPKQYLWLLRKTKAYARQEIKPTTFAREITFSGWTRTTYCHRTRSQNKWRQWRKVKVSKRFFHAAGDISGTALRKLSLFLPRCGVICHRMNGCCDGGKRIST